jgi:methylated-DNA-[protein]-cysteine S-methyltransferase
MVLTIDRPLLRRLRGRCVADEQPISMTAFSTSLDWMAIAWQDNALRGVVFGYASRRQAAVALARIPWLPHQFWRLLREGQQVLEPAWVPDVVDRLQRYAEGEPVDFSDVPIATDHLTGFGRRTVAACRRIVWGQTSTYGDLAAECGSPGAARAVGSVMAKNCYPLIVPCHRVLAAGGGLGGYSAPEGLRMKRRLLGMEGVRKIDFATNR